MGKARIREDSIEVYSFSINVGTEPAGRGAIERHGVHGRFEFQNIGREARERCIGIIKAYQQELAKLAAGEQG